MFSAAAVQRCNYCLRRGCLRRVDGPSLISRAERLKLRLQSFSQMVDSMRFHKSKYLRIILWLTAIFLMGLIYYFSAQTADNSSQTSGRVIRWLLLHLDKTFSSLSLEEQLTRMESWSFIVRKAAHALVFAALGFFLSAALSVDLPPSKSFMIAQGLGTLWGILDKAHQFFVPGRSCEFRDMCIDAAGVFLGAYFLWLLLSMIRRKKHR